MSELTYGPARHQDAPAQPLTFGQEQFVASVTTARHSGMHMRAAVPVGVDVKLLLDAMALTPVVDAISFTVAFEGSCGTLIQQSIEQLPAVHFCHAISVADLFGYLSCNDEQWHFHPGLLWQSEQQLIAIDAAQLLANQTLSDAVVATMESGSIQVPYTPHHKFGLPQLPSAPLRSRFLIHGNAHDLFALGECYPRLSALAPIQVELADRVHRQQSNRYLGYLKSLAQQVDAELTADALQLFAQTSSRWAEHNDYNSLASNYLIGLIQEANSTTNGQVTDQVLINTLESRRKRISDLAQSSYQDFVDGSMLLDVTGECVGQVNGLTVVDVGDVCYGEPARITASVHYGDGDVIDIERKAELAGNIHAKGTMILAAYVSQIFAKDAPLHLSANIVFEQSYYEVDGDSASLAELVALLSALGRIPVYQNMAVTGAIDQFGNVQSIGGVNEKVEGFWAVASRLAPEQQISIVMPKSNLLQFNPRPEIASAIASGNLLIKGVSHIAEAVEILTGMPSGVGKEDEHQRYPADTVFGKVQRRLLDLADPSESTNISLFQILRQWWRGEF